jgi:large subunit ribosomal protein L21
MSLIISHKMEKEVTKTKKVVVKKEAKAAKVVKAPKTETKVVETPKVDKSRFAIIEINKQQEKVYEGEALDVLSIKGDKFTFENVLAVVTEKEAVFGKPYIKGASVLAHKVNDFKDKKIRTETFKAKSRYRKVTGSRQSMSKLMIDKINA